MASKKNDGDRLQAEIFNTFFSNLAESAIMDEPISTQLRQRVDEWLQKTNKQPPVVDVPTDTEVQVVATWKTLEELCFGQNNLSAFLAESSMALTGNRENGEEEVKIENEDATFATESPATSLVYDKTDQCVNCEVESTSIHGDWKVKDEEDYEMLFYDSKQDELLASKLRSQKIEEAQALEAFLGGDPANDNAFEMSTTASTMEEDEETENEALNLLTFKDDKEELNSNDDNVSSDDEEFDTVDVIHCLAKKVYQKKGRFTFKLRKGLGTVNGQVFSFRSATGRAAFYAS